MKSCLCLLILLTLNLQPAFSQAPEESVKITFQAIGWASSADTEEIFFASEGETVPIAPLHATLRSDSYKYIGPPTLQFFKLIKNDQGELIPQSVGRVQIPIPSKRLLLIFFAEENDQYRILPIEDDLANFPGGSYSFINITKSQFAVQVDKELKEINYGKSAIFRLPPGEAKSVELLMAKNNGTEWERFHQTVIPHHSKRRVIFFLVEKETRGRTLVQMRQLVDYVSVEESTP